MKIIYSSMASHKLSRNIKLENIVEPTIKLCKFIGDCNVRRYLRNQNKPTECYDEKVINCQTYKFREKYKEFDNGRYLGI